MAFGFEGKRESEIIAAFNIDKNKSETGRPEEGKCDCWNYDCIQFFHNNARPSGERRQLNDGTVRLLLSGRRMTSCKHILKTIRCLAITKFFCLLFSSLLLFLASTFKWWPMRAPCCLYNVLQCCTYKRFNDMQTDNWTNNFTNRCHFVCQLPSLSSIDSLLNMPFIYAFLWVDWMESKRNLYSNCLSL